MKAQQNEASCICISNLVAQMNNDQLPLVSLH